MIINTIHQFSPAVAVDDGVSNSLFLTQKILHELGFNSKIYADHIDDALKSKVDHIDNYIPSQEHILLYHHSIGHIHHEMMMSFSDKKILVYHNITPSHFFKNYEHLQQACDEGREQLKFSKDYFIGSYADSKYNMLELEFYGYKHPWYIPLLYDSNKSKDIHPNQSIIQKYPNTFNILFVGRIVANKCQDQLIDAIFSLVQKGIENIALFIVGGVSQQDYFEHIVHKIETLHLTNKIHITNKINNEDLAAYYANADLYLSLSEHEGFGIPLLEAMQYDVPVLAYDVGGVSTPLGERGLLFFKASDDVAEKIIEIMNDSSIRDEILKYQRQQKEQFTYENLKEKFVAYLNFLNIKIPLIQPSKPSKLRKKVNYQIEGPFDSSYSLAIVNNNLAKSFYENNDNVKLYSTEGYGDFEPNKVFLKNDVVSNLIYKRKLDQIDVTIRNLYPPRTNAMQGYYKVLGPYGWEESTFPTTYIEQFNRRLSLVACMSQYVKDVMIKNGLKVPTVVTGIGVDHILKCKPKKIPYDLPEGFRLLHISSCFPRKGVDVLLKVYEKLINQNINVSLIIKSFENPHNDLPSILNKLPSHVRKKILFINEELEASQINYLYQNCDCLVAPSRGEGFGLPMAEAMLFELPVITTGYGGQVDFCKENTSWLIDYSFQKADTHMNLFDSFWAEPLQNSLEEKILEIYNAPMNEIKAKTTVAKRFILDNYKWSHLLNRLKKALKELDSPKIKESINIAWISTYNTKCGIASYSNSLITHIKDSFENITIFANIVEKDKILNTKEEKNIIRNWTSRFDKDNKKLIGDLLKGSFTDIIIQFNFAFLSMENLKDILLANQDKKITIEFHSVEDVTVKGLEASLNTVKNELKDIHNIIVHNIADLNRLKKIGIVKNATLLPLGINNIQKEAEKEKKGDKLTIATYGFLLPHKGILELIEAFYHVQKMIPNTHLLLLNALYPVSVSQEYLQVCQEKIASLHLDDNVMLNYEYLPADKSFRLLNDADLLVLAYRKTAESASAAVRDLIATQKPLLCTQQNIFNDVSDIVHFTKGFTPKEIAESIVMLLNDNAKLHKNEERQKLWIKEHDWTRVSQKFINIIKRR